MRVQELKPTRWNFISLGAGVQSSTMALMAAAGEITPMPDAAIFADTQAEPKSVYRWLEWLKLELPFAVYVVTRGSLTDTALLLRERVRTEGRPWSKSLIPVYTLESNGNRGHMQRACTYDYKLMPLRKEQKRIAGVGRGQKECVVTSWIGISRDEIQRIKRSNEPWVQHRWPLVEMEMTRRDCLRWMESHGYPEPPRSACVYCPFHSDRQWRHLHDNEPEEFARAVQFEKDLQGIKRRTDNMRGVPYLHASRIPLDQVEFSGDGRQLSLWNNECEGMCGV